MNNKLLTALVIGVVLWFFFAPQPKATWTGQRAPDEPLQTSDSLPAAWTQGKYTFTPGANYEIKAVVLSKCHYWAGAEEDGISPYDLALGWGPMSDAAIINALRITQGGRWYNYSWRGDPPLAPDTIALSSSNNHIIPADRQVLNRIASIRRFDLVTLKGYLVAVSRPDGWHWSTSLTRTDNRGGSCEVFWVKDVDIVRP